MLSIDKIFDISNVPDDKKMFAIMQQVLLLILEHENQGVVCGNLKGERFILFRNAEDKLDIAPAKAKEWYGKMVWADDNY